MELVAAAGLRHNLKTAMNEKVPVRVYVRGAGDLTGRVGGIGEECILLAELAGRSASDALVRIDAITAVELRVRAE